MKLSIYTAFIVLGIFFGSYAHASHLGPIVFGEERFERVLFCENEADAMAIAKDEERSITADETIEQYLEGVEKLLKDRPCFNGEIWYLPEETLRQWQGRKFNPSDDVSIVTISIVRSQAKKGVRNKAGVVWTNVQIFVITPDGAPPPKSK